MADSKTLRVLWPTTQTTDRGVENLHGLHQLEEIELGDTQISDAGLVHLCACALQKLGVAGTKITAAGLEHLDESCPAWLDLADTPIGDDALALAGECANLRTESLCGSAKIGDQGIAQLHRLKHLESLDVNGCTGVTDEGVAVIARLPQLKTLSLSGTKISDAGLAELEKMSALDRRLAVQHRDHRSRLEKAAKCGAESDHSSERHV